MKRYELVKAINNRHVIIVVVGVLPWCYAHNESFPPFHLIFFANILPAILATFFFAKYRSRHFCCRSCQLQKVKSAASIFFFLTAIAPWTLFTCRCRLSANNSRHYSCRRRRLNHGAGSGNGSSPIGCVCVGDSSLHDWATSRVDGSLSSRGASYADEVTYRMLRCVTLQ